MAGMDDRDISSVSRISPSGKMAVARPAVGRRELAYKLKQYDSTRKRNDIDPDEKKRELANFAEDNGSAAEGRDDKKKSSDSGGEIQDSDYMSDLKKRVLFDRAIIIGEDKFKK